MSLNLAILSLHRIYINKRLNLGIKIRFILKPLDLIQLGYSYSQSLNILFLIDCQKKKKKIVTLCERKTSVLKLLQISMTRACKY